MPGLLERRFGDHGRSLAVTVGRRKRLNYIGTEHILLGLLREEEGLAARVLDTLDITVEEVRAQVARIVGQGDEVTTGQIPFTPRAQRALELALREALSLGHNYIGTEHIPLGLVRLNEGVAADILSDFADAEKIRDETQRMLSGPGRTRRRRRRVVIGAQPAQLVVACPSCATVIETIASDRPNRRFDVSAEGDRTRPGCGKRWTIAYSVSWAERAE